MSTTNKLLKNQLMSILAQFPYAGLSISFLTKELECSPKILEKCLNNISIEDVEMLYIYELEQIPEVVKILRQRDIDKDLIKSVFNEEGKNLREKDQIKLHFFEFIDYCINN